MDAASALRRAMVSALREASDLEELTGLFDSPLPGQAFPYLSFDTHSVSDRSHKSGEGRQHRIQLSIWDDRHDRGRLYRLMAAADRALGRMPGVMDSHQLVVWESVRALAVRDPAGPDRSILTFEAITYAL